MTSLRFLGDVPLWVGLLAAVLVGVLSCRYYARESFSLPHRLKWILPLLRTSAFFLGIMLLTGPVLHHRKTIGELGRVQIYLDASKSMGQHDQHLSVERKLAVAEQLGWLQDVNIDESSVNVANELAAQRGLLDQLVSKLKARQSAEPADASATRLADDSVVLSAIVEELQRIRPGVPTEHQQEFESRLLLPLVELSATVIDPETYDVQLTELTSACDAVEQALRAGFKESLSRRIDGSDTSLRTTISRFDDTSRWQRMMAGLIDSPVNILETLKERHFVEVRTLTDEQANLIDMLTNREGQTIPDVSDPNGQVTDLNTGILASQKGVIVAGDSAAAPPQSAVVILTDGQHNAGPSPEQMAKVLGAQGVRIYTVSVGAEQSAHDQAVIGLEHPDRVFASDRVRGVLIMRDTMPAGKPFTAQVRHGETILWQQQFVTQNSLERRIEFQFGIEELTQQVGQQLSGDVTQHLLPLKLEAAIVPLAEDYETGNNTRSMHIAAVLQRNKVLIVDGRSRWETRYLRNVFSRDEQWEVDTVIAGRSTENSALPRGNYPDQFPADRDAFFGYDLLIFGEISPVLFEEYELRWIREFVELRGGGIVFIDGQRNQLRELSNTNLVDLLPIKWATNSETPPVGMLQLTEQGAATTALSLAIDPLRNRRFWNELPAPRSLVAVSAQPDAEVLVQLDNGEQEWPAIITRRFGAGRVLYLAFDETWRWRYKTADLWHQRIWNQLAAFVMPRPYSVSDQYVSIDSGPLSYQAGEAIDIRIRLSGLDGTPAAATAPEALVWKGDRIVSTVRLNNEETVPGVYRGRAPELPAGEYEVSIRAAGYSESALQARSQFVVIPPDSGELAQTAVNEELLQQMAATSGGTYLREEELGLLPELLNPLSSGRVVESETVIWQSYWWFVVMILLLTCEWILRKRAGLL